MPNLLQPSFSLPQPRIRNSPRVCFLPNITPLLKNISDCLKCCSNCPAFHLGGPPSASFHTGAASHWEAAGVPSCIALQVDNGHRGPQAFSGPAPPSASFSLLLATAFFPALGAPALGALALGAPAWLLAWLPLAPLTRSPTGGSASSSAPALGRALPLGAVLASPLGGALEGAFASLTWRVLGGLGFLGAFPSAAVFSFGFRFTGSAARTCRETDALGLVLVGGGEPAPNLLAHWGADTAPPRGHHLGSVVIWGLCDGQETRYPESALARGQSPGRGHWNSWQRAATLGLWGSHSLLPKGKPPSQGLGR